MKLSLRWIFSHLESDLKKHSVDEIVRLFNTKTAEIENCTPVSIDLASYAVARVTSIDPSHVTVLIPELKITPEQLPLRADAVIGRWYIIKEEKNIIRWATLADFNSSTKEGLLPAVSCTEKSATTGNWKKECEQEDYLIEIDNKSITHRPDMWSHRGVARELACLLNVPLVAQSKLISKIPIKKALSHFKGTKQSPLSLSLTDPSTCDRIAALPITDITYTPSFVWMALRLARVETRPLNFFVDATNYVMHDIGQPLHAFDADTLASDTLSATMASNGQKLQTLDGAEITLDQDDIIISDGKKPLSLAGIMGGKQTGITDITTNLYIESAHFNPTTIRLSATRHKVRTESSMRFEKNIDPHQTLLSIQRFVHLMKEYKVKGTIGKYLIAVGKEPKQTTIVIEHTLIEKRLGTTLPKGFVKKQLTALEYKVTELGTATKKYKVTVPTVRSTKDVTNPEDIIEEVGRLYGWDNIKPILPSFISTAHVQTEITRIQQIKQQLAFDACMHEVENYTFYDNEFLHKIGYTPTETISLANPLSEQRTQLITSLIPHLLQNIAHNSADHEQLRFFEWGRVWNRIEDKNIFTKEHKMLAGIFYTKDTKAVKPFDFYEGKAILNRLFKLLSMPVEWHTALDVPWWTHRYQVADLICNGIKIGTAGIVSQRFIHTIAEGEAFVFEIDGDNLLSFTPSIATFKPLAKYQSTTLDISVLVPTSVTIAQLSTAALKADERVENVTLIDTFIKEEWVDQKSVTMRCWIRDHHHTLSKDEIDTCHAAVIKALNACGGIFR